MRFVLGLVLALVACKSKHVDPSAQAVRADGCLALEAAPRRILRAHDNALYWLETVRERDFDAAIKSFERLVRYDLATHAQTILGERIINPVRFVREGVIAIELDGTASSLVLIRGDGSRQALVPSWYLVNDVEPVDDNTLAVLATADNKKAVYLLELANPRPMYIVDAEILLSATRDTVYIRTADGVFAVDIATGAREPRDVPDTAMPDGEYIYYVEDQQIVARSLRTNSKTVIVEQRRDWALLYQDDSVLARHAPADKPTAAYVLEDGAATRLPDLPIGTSFVGTTRAGPATWALVGHNTSNIDGDLMTATHEADVCKPDLEQSAVTYEARSIPARFMPKLTALTEGLQAFGPYHSAQVLEYADEPLTLAVEYATAGGEDLAKLREHVRALHEKVTSHLGDKEARTSLQFADGRTATYRWRRDRLRGRALAGIGDVMLSDPVDFDVETADTNVKADKDMIHCRGKVTNVRRVVLRDIEVRCIAGDRERVIRLGPLEPKQTVTFDEKLEHRDGDYLLMELFRGRTEVIVRDMVAEKKLEALYAYFTQLHADTGFALRSRDLNERFYVLVDAPDEHTPEMIADLQKRLEDARELLGAPQGADLELQVFANRRYYDWNGEQLVPID